ncbi:MAG: 4Fe-4S binding protein [DPANN group archaeon]|nr:4Fe-4S binding protein [DPANN group archaeon]
MVTKLKIDGVKCIYCGGCTSVCPVTALTLKEIYIDIDQDTCTQCNACVKFCPVDAISLVQIEGQK